MGATLAAERALWLAEHVLPCERGLRDWLRRRMAQAQDVDDVVQETYAILAAMADVSHVRQPRAYVYQVELRDSKGIEWDVDLDAKTG